MKPNPALLLSIVALLFAAAGSDFAQSTKSITAAGNEFVISAKAGGVSFVEGEVTVARASGRTERLVNSDNLEIGDKVTTGETGKTEIMLNPGSFARLGGNASFEFGNTSLDSLHLKLNSGSMILELYAGDDFKVFVRTPNALMDITRSGVYRIDALPNGSGRLSVWKGSTVFGASRVTVKTGYAVTVNGSKGTMAKFDRDSKDDLDDWSKLRGKEATKANSKLQRRALNGSLLSAFNQGAWNMYGSFGLWVFDPIRSRWFFLPFGSGWRSPYGHWYDYDIWAFNFPNYVYVNPNGSGGGNGSGSGTGGGTGNGGSTTIPPGGGRRTETKGDPSERGAGGGWNAETPIYRRFENTQRTYGDGPVNTGGRFGGGYRDNGGWSPSSGGAGGFGGGASDSKGGFGSPAQSMPPASSPVAPSNSRIMSKDDN